MAPVWLEVLEETSRLCAAHNRADLVDWVRLKRTQLLDPQLRVLVIGEPKQGKSQLINALVNASVCAVGDGVTTAIPAFVSHAEEARAVLVRANDRIPVPIEDIGALRHRAADGSAHVEIGVPRGLLASGIVLIDTPGIDGQDPSQAETLTGLARADLVVMVSDATRALSGTELDLLIHLARTHANLVLALTKIDLSPHWRDVAEQNREQLANAGVQAAILPLSATLRLQAARTGDQAINTESGYPGLVARLMRDQSGKGDELARANVHLIARTVIEQLATPLRIEASTPESPSTSKPLSRLQDAQNAVEELRRCSMRWQNTLNDEMADLISDLEFDLRDRTRKILRMVDEAFDEADPLSHWETFSEWLDENLIEAAEANYGWMLQRCDSIARRIADNFTAYGYTYDQLPRWSVRVPEDIADRVPVIDQPQIERFTVTQKVFSGLKGSYGGILMFGLATSLVGMPLINPVSLGAGAVFGGKSVMDDSKSLRKRRQSAVKGAAQRHVDDFFVRFNKDCRDTARRVQRMLRDHFTALTEELQEAIVQSFRRAKQDADVERSQRQRQIELSLRQLTVLYERAQALLSVPAEASRARLGSGV